MPPARPHIPSPRPAPASASGALCAAGGFQGVSPWASGVLAPLAPSPVAPLSPSATARLRPPPPGLPADAVDALAFRGEGAGPAVLWIHGYTMDASVWS